MTSPAKIMERKRYTRTEQVLTVCLSVFLWLVGMFFAGAAAIALTVEMPNLVVGRLDPFVVIGALAAIAIVGVMGRVLWKSVRHHGGIVNAVYGEFAALFGTQTVELLVDTADSLLIREVLVWRGRSFEEWSAPVSDIRAIAQDDRMMLIFFAAPNSADQPEDTGIWTANPSWQLRTLHAGAGHEDGASLVRELVEQLRAHGVEFVPGPKAGCFVRRGIPE